MIRLNKHRMDYQQKFEQMIAEYNTGTTDVEDSFERLLEFVGEINQEAERTTLEELSEEELVVFDFLIHPELELSRPERDEVKIAVRKLLETLKAENLVLDWRKQTQLQAQVRLAIQEILDPKLPDAYTPELFNQ